MDPILIVGAGPTGLVLAIELARATGCHSLLLPRILPLGETDALELDLLAELSGLLALEHGPVPGNYLAEARAAWPDDE